MGRKIAPLKNPFLSSFSIKVKRKKTIRRSIGDTDDETAVILGEHITYNDVEIDEFAKLYHVAGSSGLLKLLSPMGSTLLLFILFNLKQDDDWIRLRQVDLIHELDVSDSSIQKGIKNLMDNGVIAKRSIQSEYWVNPQLIFAGNRKSYAKRAGDDKIVIIHDSTPTIVDSIDTPAKPNVFYKT